jgi:hypothetical protein
MVLDALRARQRFEQDLRDELHAHLQNRADDLIRTGLSPADAVRRLIATPLFLGFAVISLALGISVTTTVHSTLYAVLCKPVGIADPARVAIVNATNGSYPARRQALSAPDFDDLRRQQRSFVALAAYRTVFQPLECRARPSWSRSRRSPATTSRPPASRRRWAA